MFSSSGFGLIQPMVLFLFVEKSKMYNLIEPHSYSLACRFLNRLFLNGGLRSANSKAR